MEMCGTCSGITGFLVFLAGGFLLMSGLGMLDGATSSVLSGALLLLYGLGVLVHSAGMCKMCKMPSKSGKFK